MNSFSNGVEKLLNENKLVSKLNNFLKLPKAQRWVCCELFYSDIDRAIFESENDFSLCLRQSFPRLKTRNLRRKEWCILRSLIGKPRRCSDSFFNEERQMLEEKRQKIRLIQQRKLTDQNLHDFKDLPNDIPITLSIGQRVYAQINQIDQQGVFIGTIAAIDTIEHTYRVVFDRASLGSQTIHDCRLRSVTPIQTIPLQVFLQTFRTNHSCSTHTLTSSLSKTSNVILASHASSSSSHQLKQIHQQQQHLQLVEPTAQLTLTPLNFSAAASALATVQSIITPLTISNNNIIAASTTTTSSDAYNLLVDDFNTLNASNLLLTNSLMFNSNIDPMLGGGGTSYSMDSLGSTSTFSQPQQLTTANMNTAYSNENALEKQINNSMNMINSNVRSVSQSSSMGLLGNFPVRFLLVVTRFSKILNIKREKVLILNEMNTKAESIKAMGSSKYTREFQMNYAINILELEKLNKDLSDYLACVQKYCEELAPEFKLMANSECNNNNTMNMNNENENMPDKNDDNDARRASSSATSLNRVEKLKRAVYAEANLLVANKIEQQQQQQHPVFKSKRIIDLITKLTALLLQIRDLISSNSESSNADRSLHEQETIAKATRTTSNASFVSFLPFCTRALNESIDEIKRSLLSRKNQELFENKVQVHINHIQSSLCQHSKLHPFNYELVGQSRPADLTLSVQPNAHNYHENNDHDTDNNNVNDVDLTYRQTELQELDKSELVCALSKLNNESDEKSSTLDGEKPLLLPKQANYQVDLVAGSGSWSTSSSNSISSAASSSSSSPVLSTSNTSQTSSNKKLKIGIQL